MFAFKPVKVILTIIHILLLFQESDGEKSDENLIVDVSNEVRKKKMHFVLFFSF